MRSGGSGSKLIFVYLSGPSRCVHNVGCVDLVQQFCLSLLAVGLLVFARAFPPEPERQWASWLVDLKRPTRFWRFLPTSCCKGEHEKIMVAMGALKEKACTPGPAACI
mmetsp:Transcript_37/g.93  ORF Transcript_37/g.93 Transcript_37/m.93 type:complete len:108 (+) Transcript_37:1125-1448(+)